VATKKRWTLIGSLALFTLCVYLFPFLVHAPYSLKDVSRIRAGMTILDVEAILGKPFFRSNSVLVPSEYSLHYDLADGRTSISYDGNDKVAAVNWANEEKRFWQSIKWLVRRD
jgi:hypothetical protein